MLRVVIADDEPKVCQLIFHLVDWEQFGLEVVGIVNDGLAAYQMIMDKEPEIVITDIRMPNYDGLELIRRAKEHNPDIYFIIISGYSHFEYARSAIKYGVEDYLLKPLKKKELERTLGKIVDKHSNKKAAALHMERLHNILHASEEKARKNLIADMFLNPAGVMQSVKRGTVNEEYRCRFIDGAYAILKIKPFLPGETFERAELSLLLSKLHQLVKERLETCCEELVLSIREDCVLGILNAKDPDMLEVKKRLNRLKTDFARLNDIFHQVRVIMGLGGIKRHMADLFQSLEEADICVLNRIGKPDESFFEHADQNTAGITVQDIVNLEFRNDFLAGLERFDLDGLASMIEMIGSRLEPYADDGRLVYNSYLEIANIFLFGAKNFNIEIGTCDTDWFQQRYDMYMNLREVFTGLARDIQAMLTDFETKKHLRDKKPIRLAKQLIHEKYSEPLSLDTVSKSIGFNPAYFSYLFKKETGKTFSEYLTEVRMEQAKRMLLNSDLDVYEIASCVGYADEKYFSRLFRKMIGLSPSEYKKLYG